MVTKKSDHVPSSSSFWRFTQRFSGFSLVLLVIIIGGVFALAPGLRNLVEQRQQIAALQAQVAQQSESVQTLTEQTDRWQDPAYIKAQTRQRLFFVVPGEQSFVVLNDTGTSTSASTDQTPTTSITATQYDWRELLAQSWYTAATTTVDISSSDVSGTSESPSDSGSSSESGSSGE